MGGLNTESLGLGLYYTQFWNKKYSFRYWFFLIGNQSAEKVEEHDDYLDLFQKIVNVWFHSVTLCYLLILLIVWEVR